MTTPIYSTLSDDEDMAELVAMFVAEIPEKLERIATLLAAENWDELKRLTHQLKGAAGGYGFDAVTPFAQTLESLLQKTGNSELNSVDLSHIELVRVRAHDLMAILSALRLR